MMDQLIQVVDCLSDAKVQKVLQAIELESDKFTGAPVHHKNAEFHVDTSVRSNTCFSADDDGYIARAIHLGMTKSLVQYKNNLVNYHSSYDSVPLPNARHTTIRRERIQILKYVKQQQYKWHTDQFPQRDHRLHSRELSIVLYLTNDFTGGRTCLPNGCYKPLPGQALVFPSNWCFPHSAEPIESGTKIVSVAWFHADYHE